MDAAESQRQERLQAARRIRRSKSYQSQKSYSSDSKGESSPSTSCLPSCFSMPKSDKDSRHDDQFVSSFSFPDSNLSAELSPKDSDKHKEWEEALKGYADDCPVDNKDDATAPLLKPKDYKER